MTALVRRFQTTCWRRSGSPVTGPAAGSRTWSRRMPLASAAGRTVSTAARDDGGEVDGLDVEAELAADDAAHVEQVLDELGLGAGVALDDLEALGEVVGVGAAAACGGAGPSRGWR